MNASVNTVVANTIEKYTIEVIYKCARINKCAVNAGKHPYSGEELLNILFLGIQENRDKNASTRTTEEELVQNNQKKKLTKKNRPQLVDKIFNPNNQGISDWVDILNITNGGLPWTTNGNLRHNVAFSDSRYVWECSPPKGKVKKLRTIGFGDNEFIKQNRPIRKDIREYHIKTGCVVCGSNSSLVIDHKNDLYNDSRVLNIKTQTKDDFQCLCTHCNLLKRTIAQKTRDSGKRYGSTNIPSMAVYGVDFISGDETYDKDDVNATVGTYWHDPVAFMETVYNMKKMS
jgi:hypothetical protein